MGIVTSDLAAMFAEQVLTNPVTLGAQSTRGIFDRAGALQRIGGVEMSAMTQVLFVQKDTLTLSRGAEILIGPVGEASAAGGIKYHVNDFEPIDDGEIVAIALAGAP